MHVELVTNVVPGANDDLSELRQLARWLVTELGPEIPWHITRFYPRWRRLDARPTPLSTLERIREVGREEGLRFAYLGNVGQHPANHTYCPRCGKLLIERREWDLVRVLLRNGRCPDCGEGIYGRFD